MTAKLDHELKKSIAITENGRATKVSKGDALVKTLVARALRGDVRSAQMVINNSDSLRGHDTLQPADLDALDMLILEQYAPGRKAAGDAQNDSVLLAASLSAALRQDLYSFIIKTFGTVGGSRGFLPNWHIKLIADRLTRVYSGEIKRLIICLPPRNLKSISASVAFPAWDLGKKPGARFICASHGNDLPGSWHAIVER